jgi:hypothetical protein
MDGPGTGIKALNCQIFPAQVFDSWAVALKLFLHFLASRYCRSIRRFSCQRENMMQLTARSATPTRLEEYNSGA